MFQWFYLWRVHEKGCSEIGLIVFVVGEDGRIVEDRGQHVDGRHRDEQEEGRLHEGALLDRLAVIDADAKGQQDGGPTPIHHSLMEQQPLRPPANKHHGCTVNFTTALSVCLSLAPFHDSLSIPILVNK